MAGNFLSDFFNGPQVQNYSDPYRGQIDANIAQLNSGNLGKEFAANTTGIIRRQANDNLRAVGNSGIGRNAAALSAVTDKSLTTADQDITGAQLKGAQYDTNNKIQASQMMEKSRDFDYQNFERMDEQRRQPSPFESLLNTAVGTVAGGLTGGLAAGLGEKVFSGITAPDDNNNNQQNPRQTSYNSPQAQYPQLGYDPMRVITSSMDNMANAANPEENIERMESRNPADQWSQYQGGISRLSQTF